MDTVGGSATEISGNDADIGVRDRERFAQVRIFEVEV